MLFSSAADANKNRGVPLLRLRANFPSHSTLRSYSTLTDQICDWSGSPPFCTFIIQEDKGPVYNQFCGLAAFILRRPSRRPLPRDG